MQQLLEQSGRQAHAATGTPSIDHLAAIAGGHTGTEAMGAGALQPAGLKCALHWQFSLDTAVAVWANEKDR